MSVDIVTPIVVDNPEQLQIVLSELLGEPSVGVDTESNSLYRYHERVCLIQLSSRKVDYVIDPLAVNVRPLAQLFASNEVEKVFHAGEYDIMCLKRDYGFAFASVFDTMIAARLTGMKHIGLASLLQDLLSVKLDKDMQQADWGERPLSEDKLRYAALDSHYLLRLRDILGERLRASHRLRQAQESFSALCALGSHSKTFDPDGYLRLRGARDLDRVELSVLCQLYYWRETKARELDRPPFRIASNETLVKLAMLQPRSVAALELMVSGSSRTLLSHAHEVLEAINRGIERREWDRRS